MIIEDGGVGASLSVIRLVMSVSPRACCRKTFRNRIFEFKIGSNRVKNNKLKIGKRIKIDIYAQREGADFL